jgi:hypothetical protein
LCEPIGGVGERENVFHHLAEVGQNKAIVLVLGNVDTCVNHGQFSLKIKFAEQGQAVLA